MCQLFAVDMAFCGGEGLITDKASALVVMACSPVCRLRQIKRRVAMRLNKCSFTPHSLRI